MKKRTSLHEPGWILWAITGYTTSFSGWYSGPIYKEIEGFDTKKECYAAAQKYISENETIFHAKNDPSAIQCWPAGHNPNRI